MFYYKKNKYFGYLIKNKFFLEIYRIFLNYNLFYRYWVFRILLNKRFNFF